VKSPITISGSIFVLDKEAEQLTAKLFEAFKNELHGTYSVFYATSANELKFTAPIFRFIWKGWHFLNGISSGTLKIEARTYNFHNNVSQQTGKKSAIRYTLNFLEVFVICLAFTLIPLALWNVLWSSITFVSIWGIVFGGNVVLSKFRFEQKINDILISLYSSDLEMISRNVYVKSTKEFK